MPWPWNPGYRSVKVIGNVSMRYSAYDFQLTFYTNYGSISCCFWDIQCRKMSWVSWVSLKVVPFGRSCIVSYQCSLLTLSLKCTVFEIFDFLSTQWPWNPGWGSLKVIENYTIQSGTHDFLLTFHSNHRTVSEINGDFRRKSHKNRQFFPPNVFTPPPSEGVPLGIGYQCRGQKKLEWWGYQMVEKVLR